jgi:surfactin family lipopeptide synthetase A/fengycin family lipopeptide synthetase B
VVFDVPAAVDKQALERAWRAVATHHDAFRLRFERDGARWRMQYAPLADDFIAHSAKQVPAQALQAEVDAVRKNVALERAPLFRLLYTQGAPSRIVIVANHSVADAMSLQIVAEDFATAYSQALAGRQLSLPAVPTPLASFLRRYDVAARTGRFHDDAASWLERAQTAVAAATVAKPTWTGVAVMGSICHLPIEIDDASKPLLSFARASFLSPRDVLLAGLAMALREHMGPSQLDLLLLSSGREQPRLGDLSRTVGCLANLVSVRIDLERAQDPSSASEVVEDAIKSLPSGGFSLPAILTSEPPDTRLAVSKLLFDGQLLFNYKGVLGPRSALGPSMPELRGAPGTLAAELVARIQDPGDPLPACLALQVHFELVDERVVGDLFHKLLPRTK